MAHVLGACLSGLALCLVGCLVRQRRVLLPPGPPGWPFIGNLADFRKYAPYKTFGSMSTKYGPIIGLSVMGSRYIVLNSIEAAKGLLEKKSTISSNRLYRTMAKDLVGWKDTTILLQYNETHRKHRKFFHQQIGTKSSLEVFYPAAEMEAKQFMHDLLESPNNVIACSRKMASSVTLRISHGYSVKGDSDPLVEMANKAMRIFSTVMAPGRFLVDTFPMLRYLPEWFPGGGFRKDAKRWRQVVNETAETPHRLVMEHLAKGDALPSLTSRLLQEAVTPEDKEASKWVGFSMYVGGSDTTPSALSAFFLAMTMYPEVFKRGQAELDTVVGSERLPVMKDRNALPYVNAICKELLRWHVVSPMAMHVTTQDTTYDGFFIPKGTCLIGNLWWILSDPNTYPNPDVFDPERFLGENQQLDPHEVCFGWGRRACPGALLAEATIFICAAMTFATLDVSSRVENGVEVVQKYDAEEGTIRHVKPFKCVIAPRSKKAEELLHA